MLSNNGVKLPPCVQVSTTLPWLRCGYLQPSPAVSSSPSGLMSDTKLSVAILPWHTILMVNRGGGGCSAWTWFFHVSITTYWFSSIRTHPFKLYSEVKLGWGEKWKASGSTEQFSEDRPVLLSVLRSGTSLVSGPGVVINSGLETQTQHTLPAHRQPASAIQHHIAD